MLEMIQLQGFKAIQIGPTAGDGPGVQSDPARGLRCLASQVHGGGMVVRGVWGIKTCDVL